MQTCLQRVCVCTIWTDVKTSTSQFCLSICRGTGADLPIQSNRSYGISVDEWSDQPLVTCIIYRFLRQGAKPRTPTTENLVFTQLSQSEIFFGVVFNLIRMVFLQSWWRAKPRTLQRLFSISGTLSMAGLICMRGDSVPNGSLKWSILV